VGRAAGTARQTTDGEGLGLELIERAASFELEGAVKLTFASKGLTCQVVFPLQ
jgi:two-component sensor histidine kinase